MSFTFMVWTEIFASKPKLFVLPVVMMQWLPLLTEILDWNDWSLPVNGLILFTKNFLTYLNGWFLLWRDDELLLKDVIIAADSKVNDYISEIDEQIQPVFFSYIWITCLYSFSWQRIFFLCIGAFQKSLCLKRI